MSDDSLNSKVFDYLQNVFPQLPVPLLLQVILDTIKEATQIAEVELSYVSQSCVDQLLELSASSDEESPLKQFFAFSADQEDSSGSLQPQVSSTSKDANTSSSSSKSTSQECPQHDKKMLDLLKHSVKSKKIRNIFSSFSAKKSEDKVDEDEVEILYLSDDSLIDESLFERKKEGKKKKFSKHSVDRDKSLVHSPTSKEACQTLSDGPIISPEDHGASVPSFLIPESVVFPLKSSGGFKLASEKKQDKSSLSTETSPDSVVFLLKGSGSSLAADESIQFPQNTISGSLFTEKSSSNSKTVIGQEIFESGSINQSGHEKKGSIPKSHTNTTSIFDMFLTSSDTSRNQDKKNEQNEPTNPLSDFSNKNSSVLQLEKQKSISLDCSSTSDTLLNPTAKVASTEEHSSSTSTMSPSFSSSNSSQTITTKPQTSEPNNVEKCQTTTSAATSKLSKSSKPSTFSKPEVSSEEINMISFPNSSKPTEAETPATNLESLTTSSFTFSAALTPTLSGSEKPNTESSPLFSLLDSNGSSAFDRNSGEGTLKPSEGAQTLADQSSDKEKKANIFQALIALNSSNHRVVLKSWNKKSVNTNPQAFRLKSEDGSNSQVSSTHQSSEKNRKDQIFSGVQNTDKQPQSEPTYCYHQRPTDNQPENSIIGNAPTSLEEQLIPDDCSECTTKHQTQTSSFVKKITTGQPKSPIRNQPQKSLVKQTAGSQPQSPIRNKKQTSSSVKQELNIQPKSATRNKAPTSPVVKEKTDNHPTSAVKKQTQSSFVVKEKMDNQPKSATRNQVQTSFDVKQKTDSQPASIVQNQAQSSYDQKPTNHNLPLPRIPQTTLTSPSLNVLGSLSDHSEDKAQSGPTSSDSDELDLSLIPEEEEELKKSTDNMGLEMDSAIQTVLSIFPQFDIDTLKAMLIKAKKNSTDYVSDVLNKISEGTLECQTKKGKQKKGTRKVKKHLKKDQKSDPVDFSDLANESSRPVPCISAPSKGEREQQAARLSAPVKQSSSQGTQQIVSNHSEIPKISQQGDSSDSVNKTGKRDKNTIQYSNLVHQSSSNQSQQTSDASQGRFTKEDNSSAVSTSSVEQCYSKGAPSATYVPPDTSTSNRKRKADSSSTIDSPSPRKSVKKGVSMEKTEYMPVSETTESEHQFESVDCEMNCEVCFEDSSIKKIGQCSDGHLSCSSCIEKQVLSFLTLDQKKTQLDCQVKDCKSFLSLDQVFSLMQPSMTFLIKHKIEKENLARINNLPDIVQCPECGFRAEFPHKYKEIHCGNSDCMLAFCRYCKKSWNDCHHENCSSLLLFNKLGSERFHESRPRFWSDIQVETDKDFISINVEKDSEEYQSVARQFYQTVKKQINSIIRIQNKKLWQKFALAREHISDNIGLQKLNERHLYHGTDVKNIELICRDGFDWRLSGIHGEALGKGAYFAVQAVYSDRFSQICAPGNVLKSSRLGLYIDNTSGENSSAQNVDTPSSSSSYINTAVHNTFYGSHFGQYNMKHGSTISGKRVKYMLVARVVCGHYTEGSKNLRLPPKDTSDPKQHRYDSVVDRVSHPSIYCIFDSAQSYPEYLIEYESDSSFIF